MIDSTKVRDKDAKALIEKVKNGEQLNGGGFFSGGEVKDMREYALAYDSDFREIVSDEDRWTKLCYCVFNIDGQWYRLDYQLGLTEQQEDVYEAQVAAKVNVKVGYVKVIDYGDGNVVPAGETMSIDEIRKKALWNNL